MSDPEVEKLLSKENRQNVRSAIRYLSECGLNAEQIANAMQLREDDTFRRPYRGG